VANSQDRRPSQHPDLLAAVVLHTLVTEGRDGMTVAAIATDCQRDPSDPHDMDEIEAALEILRGDDLAEPGNGLYRPTRAAVRAYELSF
jgi:hypothetical protein